MPGEEHAVIKCVLRSLLFLVRIKVAVSVCCLRGVLFLLITVFKPSFSSFDFS